MSREANYRSGPHGPSGVRAVQMRLRLPFLSKNKETLPPIQASDLRDIGPTHQCVCGCTVFTTYVQFQDYEIVWYALDVECTNCGNLLKAPCPVDRPE